MASKLVPSLIVLASVLFSQVCLDSPRARITPTPQAATIASHPQATPSNWIPRGNCGDGDTLAAPGVQQDSAAPAQAACNDGHCLSEATYREARIQTDSQERMNNLYGRSEVLRLAYLEPRDFKVISGAITSPVLRLHRTVVMRK